MKNTTMEKTEQDGSGCDVIIYIRRDENPAPYIDENGDEQEGESGWLYDMYTSTADFEKGRSIDGGLCTGSRADAIDMASAQAYSV